MEIAVFVGIDGLATSLDQEGIVQIFSNSSLEWRIIKEIPFHGDQLTNVMKIRTALREMLMQLTPCKVFAATNIIGIPKVILNDLDFSTWNVEGKPLQFLDQIAEDEEKPLSDTLHDSQTILPAPIPSGEEGHYSIDLQATMQKDEGISSKQILMPFFTDIPFTELTIICGHVPPWFESILPKLNLQYRTESQANGTFKVVVFKA